jgi:cytochrome c oxidase accessory protein FixG
MPKQAPSPIAPKRTLVKWLTTLLVLLLPFVQPGGVSLLRLDAASRTLLFFGARLRLEEFFLLLLATLALVFGFLFMTLVFGRVWCGWLCPQTTLIDLAEFLERRFGGTWPGRILCHLTFVLLSLLLGANLLWYFMTPQDFFLRLAGGTLGMTAGITLASVAVVTWLNLVFLRRTFCTAACPYGRIQLLVTDRSTLTLEFDPAASSRCIRCGACVRACPTGIDIRQGLQVECINCGRCLDACRTVMAKRGEPGIIHYTFGRRDEGGGRPLNMKTLSLGLLSLLFVASLFWGVSSRKTAVVSVMRNALAPSRTVPGGLLLPYTAVVENRSGRTLNLDLRVAPPAGTTATIMGPVSSVVLAANQNRRLDFFLRLAPSPSSPLMVELTMEERGVILDVQQLRVVPQ